jgi:methylated-DNA-[protein]-cysteine S-methyltransferase
MVKIDLYIVGSALRNNPFAPLVPCHRVVASNFFIGGFCGEWGQNPNKGDQESLFDKKKRMLAEEGVFFDDKGYLKKGQDVIWKGP